MKWESKALSSISMKALRLEGAWGIGRVAKDPVWLDGKNWQVITTRIERYSTAFQQVKEKERNWENIIKNRSQQNRTKQRRKDGKQKTEKKW